MAAEKMVDMIAVYVTAVEMCEEHQRRSELVSAVARCRARTSWLGSSYNTYHVARNIGARDEWLGLSVHLCEVCWFLALG